MATTQKVSRPGNEQYLVVEHAGETYEAEKQHFQREVDGELVDVEEYRLDEDRADVPADVQEAVDEANGALEEDEDDDRPDGDQCAHVKDDDEQCQLPAGDDGYCHLDAHQPEE